MNRVIKFGAAWCGPCRAMKPHFEKFQSDVKDNTEVEILDLDVDKDHAEAEKYGVQSIPYTVFVKDGEVSEARRGMLSSEKLLSIYQEVYKK